MSRRKRTCGVNFRRRPLADFLLQAWPCVKRVFAAVCLPFPRQPARPLPVATRRCSRPSILTANLSGTETTPALCLQKRSNHNPSIITCIAHKLLKISERCGFENDASSRVTGGKVFSKASSQPPEHTARVRSRSDAHNSADSYSLGIG